MPDLGAMLAFFGNPTLIFGGSSAPAPTVGSSVGLPGISIGLPGISLS